MLVVVCIVSDFNCVSVSVFPIRLEIYCSSSSSKKSLYMAPQLQIH